MIRIRNLSKQYNGEKVLDAISMDFVEGNLYVLKGVSGCGKTTLLNIIAGLDTDFEGTVENNGLQLGKKEIKKYRETVGYIFQQSLLLSNLNILENLKLIYPNDAKITEYAKEFHVEHLLNKYPSQCSNGERQRVAIIRALLLDCPIILADEPTASLDIESSKDIANAFLSVREDRRIIIVVTHEDCFDGIGNEIVNLDYGKVNSNHNTKTNKNEVPIYSLTCKSIDFLKQDLQYAKAKKKHSSIIFSVCLCVISCVSLLLLGAYFHLQEGLETYAYENYPYQTMRISNKQIETSEIPIDKLKKYENYYMERKNVGYVPYLPKDDSILNTNGIIEIGNFPSSADEVLLNKKAAKIMFNYTEQIVGKELVFEGEIYNISGIVAEDKLYEIANSYPSYSQTYNTPTVFIDYHKLSTLAEPMDMDEHLYSIEKSDILDPEWSVYLKKYSPYRNIVEAQLYSIEKVMEMLVLCIPILLFLAFIFLFNMLYMEMFYRKQEIGYLQIFHVSKYRIQRMIYMEYLLKFMKPILAGYSIYVLVSLLIFTEFQITIALSILEFIVSMIFILLYLLLLVICPLKLLLRQPILRLIR